MPYCKREGEAPAEPQPRAAMLQKFGRAKLMLSRDVFTAQQELRPPGCGSWRVSLFGRRLLERDFFGR